MFLKEIEDQTEAICLAAAKQDGWVLKFVKKPTEEILLEAIRNYKVPFGSVLEGIVNPTENLYWIAVKEDGLELEYVKNQTPKICLEAVKRCGWALEYVENQIGEVCLVALLQDSRSYKVSARKPRGLAPWMNRTFYYDFVKFSVYSNKNMI